MFLNISVLVWLCYYTLAYLVFIWIYDTNTTIFVCLFVYYFKIMILTLFSWLFGWLSSVCFNKNKNMNKNSINKYTDVVF